jgi:hypothetical protein
MNRYALKVLPTWIEPADAGGHKLRCSIRQGNAWTAATTVYTYKRGELVKFWSGASALMAGAARRRLSGHLRVGKAQGFRTWLRAGPNGS